MAEQHPFRKRFYSRKEAAVFLGYVSIYPVIELERQGKLTKHRFTGPRSQVFLDHEDLVALASERADA